MGAAQYLVKPGAAGLSDTPVAPSKQDASSKISHLGSVIRRQMLVVTTGSVNASSS